VERCPARRRSPPRSDHLQRLARVTYRWPRRDVGTRSPRDCTFRSIVIPSVPAVDVPWAPPHGVLLRGGATTQGAKVRSHESPLVRTLRPLPGRHPEIDLKLELGHRGAPVHRLGNRSVEPGRELGELDATRRAAESGGDRREGDPLPRRSAFDARSPRASAASPRLNHGRITNRDESRRASTHDQAVESHLRATYDKSAFDPGGTLRRHFSVPGIRTSPRRHVARECRMSH